MDQTTLRLILLALGSLLVAGIYLWDKYQHRIRNTRSFAQRKRNPKTPHRTQANKPFTPTQANTPTAEKKRHEPFISEQKKTAIASSNETKTVKQAPEIIVEVPERESVDLPANKPFLLDTNVLEKAPQLILQLHIVTRNEPFSLAKIHTATKMLGLQHGAMQIYHRPSEIPDKPLFSMASMLEPGILPAKNEPDFKTPGLTLFTELPGVQDGSAIYTEMLFTAQRLADLLQADLQDETHSALTKQAIEHTRDNILEHERKIELLKIQS